MNVIARLEYELAYYDSAVHRFSHYTTRTLPNNIHVIILVICMLISVHIYRPIRTQKFLYTQTYTYIFIINGFRTFVFIFIVISTRFRTICPPSFFLCLLNSGTYTERRPTCFIESTGVTCSDSICHNRVQMLSIPVLLPACSQDWTCTLQIFVSLEA